ncbi:MAG: hypothetical protein VKQ33_05205 [Candidatus Sericytochromatia bacterium]|nr:hypothetical protein [Candidatus Sericytochromatia bacterium]
MPLLPPLAMRLAIALAAVMAGCASPQPASIGLAAPEPERIVRSGPYRPVMAVNRGRIVGTVVLDGAPAGVTTAAGGEAQPLDPEGQPLAEAATVDDGGHFVLEGLKASRDRILVRVRLSGPRGTLRLTALARAPRKAVDSPVVLDAATTLVADRLQRGQRLGEVEADTLPGEALERLEDVTAAYMTAQARTAVLQEPDGAFNAFAFDHLMDDHPGLKQLVWEVAPGLLRGWRPPGERFAAPPPPSPSPTAGPPGNRVGPPAIPGVTS